MTRVARLFCLVVFCLVPLTARAEDPTLLEIYNNLFQTNLSSEQLDLYLEPDETWGALVGQVRAQAVFSNSNSFILGTYDTGTGQQTELFTVTTRGYLNGQPRKNIMPLVNFGFYVTPGAYENKYSQPARNPGGYDNLRVYSSPFDGIYLLAWEETDNLTDADFNDFVATFRIDTPPVAVAGTIGSSPFPANPNRKVQVTLDGSASYDDDGDPLTYRWAWPGGAAVGVNPVITLPEGDTIITLIVNDGIVDSAPDTVTVSVTPAANIVPVADAGEDQTVAPELNHYAQVTLNGLGSYDGNEDPLAYEWTWTDHLGYARSAGGASPSISLYEGFVYTITLQVWDGYVWSTPDTCQVTVSTVDNIAPVVTAPEDLSIHADQDGIARVQLTAFGFDSNEDPLTYDWSWSGGSASGQTIMANLPEDPTPPVEAYTYTVTVQAFDGQAYSQPDTCLVTVLPSKPIADAGTPPPPVTAELNHTKQVTLDGTASYSRYGYPLTYRWSWPPNKTATGPTPTITLPQGITTILLVVNDGYYDSEPATIDIEVLPADNLPPVADAGEPQTVSPDLNHRAIVQLDGSGSWDPNSDLLTYTWTWTDLGTQLPMQATGPTPQVELYEGENHVSLRVFDGEFEVFDEVVITLTPVPNLAPVAEAGPDQTLWPRLDRTAAVRLDGRGSSDPNQDPLTYTWTWTDIVTGQPEAETGARPTVILPIGVTVIRLVVNDGLVSSTNEEYVTITVTSLHARVPSDFATVQQAIDFCEDGDTVVLERGSHSGNINFLGKAITVMGEKGWEDTIIDAGGGVSGVTFASGEGPDSKLMNVTIRRGFNVSGGAGIRIDDASPTIVSCRLTANSQGGAIFVRGAAAAPRLSNLLIHGNNVSNYGSAFWIKDAARPVITNCTIYGNSSGGLGGAIYLDNCQAQFRDCIIWGNAPRPIVDNFTYSSFVYCNIGPLTNPWSGTGNIALEPAFIAGNLSEFYLKPASPCVDRGSSTVEEWQAEMAAFGEDVAGILAGANTRSTGKADTGILDMGFHHHPEPIRLLRVWLTDTGGKQITSVARTQKCIFWLEYQIEGAKKTSYVVKRILNISGPFTLKRAAKTQDVPGTYQKQIGTLNKPITIPSFSMPPGYSSVDALFVGTVRIKKPKTTVWLGEDSMSIIVPIR